MNALFQHRAKILDSYDGSLPLALFLKQYFRQFPVLGSRDRRILSALTYSHYRAGKAIDNLVDEKLQIASELILCEQDGTEYQRMLEGIQPAAIGASLDERIQQVEKLGASVNTSNIMPYDVKLSSNLSKEDWISRLLNRTAVFIKPEKGFDKEVSKRLEKAEIPFEVGENAEIKLKQGVNLEAILEPKSFRVQDWASQQIAQFLPKESPLFIWDVCAGAGGKSLILSEQFPKAKLLVSDVRPSILRNLEERFKLHRRNLPQMMEIDLTQLPEDVDPLDGKKADLIVCDVPCSGSGTWGRTPEQAWFFKPESINEFSEKQRNIVLRAADFLTDDGTLFYITCSVFASENEDNTQKICESGRLKIIHQTIINGFDNQADCLFVSVLKKV
jgi:16S rRNA (cytosine967-C5)-methyltransferase